MSKKLRIFIKTILSATLTCIAGTFFMVSCKKSTPESVGVAPTVISVPKDKLVEVGTYTDFDSDMESILITDDNQEQLPYVTKKPISIKIGNKIEENASGFTTYRFWRSWRISNNG